MAIKSAYELALERMGGEPGKKLTPHQKAKLAELDRVYSAKIAEEELSLNPKIATARAAGEETLRAQVQKLRRKLDAEKEAARQGK